MKKIALALALMLLAAPAALAAHPGKHVFVTINGLVCDFCARAMEKTFGKQDPVAGIKVDLTAKIVTIDLKDGLTLSDETIRKGVLDAGYEVVEIKRD